MLSNASKNKGFSTWVFSGAYFYIALPIFIFICGHFKPEFCIVILPLLIVSYIFAVRTIVPIEIGQFNKEDIIKLFLGLGIIVLWVYLSGIGGFTVENGDTPYRNSIFELLVKEKWPVHKYLLYRGEITCRTLCYYTGFWLPCAVIGKIFGMQAGWVFQLVWAVFGVFLCYLMICLIFRKVRLWPLIIFIFFGGLDFFGTAFMSGRIIPLAEVSEWWAGIVQYTSFGKQLATVFNQAIPAWVATLLIISQKNNKNAIYTLGNLFICAIFPFAGLGMIVLFNVIMHIYKLSKRNEPNIWKRLCSELLTFQNIIGGGIAGITAFLYYLSNATLTNVAGVSARTATSQYFASLSNKISVELQPNIIYMYDNFRHAEETSYIWVLFKIILFVFLEVGIYYFFIYESNKHNSLYWFSLIILALLPFVTFIEKLGSTRKDIIMRTSVPFLIILYLFVVKEIIHTQRKKRIIILALLCIGSLVTLTVNADCIKRIAAGEKFEKTYIGDNVILTGGNFSGDGESFIYQSIFKEYTASELENQSIVLPIKKQLSGLMTVGTLLEQDNGCWMVDNYKISLDGETTSDIKLSCFGSMYGDAQIYVCVNGNKVGYLEIEGENKDSQLSTVRSIIIDNKYLNEGGQLIELVCDNPQTYYVNEEINTSLSMFISEINIEKISR